MGEGFRARQTGLITSRTRKAVSNGRATRRSYDALVRLTDFERIGFPASRLSSTAASKTLDSSDRMPRRESTEATVASNLAVYARRPVAVTFVSGT
ncbi:hypothetical protein SALB_01478 [Streptomyces noursei]|uniref:Uncharacterized protein n=1 Tax=Streptomyces noursei TaxID=1971 RepID=A0A401QTX3_STRNR|nr:hypothetical protein SALB_01478 [Streptomyces noursei]